MLALALQYFESGELQDARHWLSQALDLQPCMIDAWHLLALCEYSSCAVQSDKITRALAVFAQFHALVKYEHLDAAEHDAYLNLRLTWTEFKLRSRVKLSAKLILEEYVDLFALFRHQHDIAEMTGEPSIESLNAGMQEYFAMADYPVVNSLYPVVQFQSDTRGFQVASPFFPNRNEYVARPLQQMKSRRHSKMRYIELWVCISQKFRDCGELALARRCCQYVLDVEVEQADVQVEIGVLTLLESVRVTTPDYLRELMDDGDDDDDSHDGVGLRSELADMSLDTMDAQHAMIGHEAKCRALDHFKSALVHDNNHMAARYWLARVYVWQNRHALARFELERAIRAGRIRGCKDWRAWQLLADTNDHGGKKMQCWDAAMVNRWLCVFDMNGARGVECLRSAP